MSIKISEILHNDKLLNYFEQIKKDQEDRERIQNLTKQLLEKSQKKLKLQNRSQRVDLRFNEKLKNMKGLSTFIDGKEQIISQNILNNQKLLQQIHTQMEKNQIIHEEEELESKLNPKNYVNLQNSNQQVFQDNKSTKQFYIATKKKKENTEIRKHSLSKPYSNLQLSTTTINDSKNFNTLFENGLLESNKNQIKLSVSKYYQKYQSKTNEFIRKLKIECMKKYQPKIISNKKTQESQSPENTKSLQQYQSLRPSQIMCTSFNLSPEKQKFKLLEMNQDNLRDSCNSFSKQPDSKTKTLNTMIDFYQNQDQNQLKRYKTPQYRRRIGNSFQKFNKSLTEIESEINKNSKNNSEILRKMETIVNDVFDQFKTQQSLYNFD